MTKNINNTQNFHFREIHIPLVKRNIFIKQLHQKTISYVNRDFRVGNH